MSSGQDAPFQDQRGDRTLEHEARRGGVYQFEDDLGKVVAAKGTPSLLAAGIGVPWTGEKGGPVEVQSLDGKPLFLAFDHAEILAMAILRLRGKLDYSDVGFAWLPENFKIGRASCRERVCQYV